MDSKWVCGICHQPLKSPVVTDCGHTFCWRCLCSHMETSSNCPLCNNILDKTKFIAIFGHGKEDPHLEDLPPLPEDNPPPPRQNQRNQQTNQQFNHRQGRGMPQQIHFNLGGFQFVHTIGGMPQFEEDFQPDEDNPDEEPIIRRRHIPRWASTLFLVSIMVILHLFSNVLVV